jgi:PAS domain S-box-containing protein
LIKVNLEPPRVDHEKSGEEDTIRVLHVDDEAGFLKATKQILEMQGSFEVETAESVEEAQEKMRKKEFDVIVCDYIMPGKDGLEFLKELRDGNNTIPFIIFTGKGREIVAIRALNLGADQYVNKIGKPEAVYTELAYGIRKVVKTKQAEEALQKSEEKYRSLFENAGNVSLMLDLKGNVISINKAALEYGFKKDEVIGKNMRKFVRKKYWPKLLKDLLQLARGKTAEGKIEINTPKGKKNAEYTSNPIIINNKVVGVQAVLRDTTESKRMEEALQESEENYRRMIEQAPDLIVTIDEKGIVTSCNPALERGTDYSQHEIIGKHFIETPLLHGIDPAYAQKLFNAIIEEKHPDPIELTWFIKDGTPRISEVRIGLMKKEGKIAGFTAVARDITERKKAEEALQKSEEKYRTVFENTGTAMCILEEDKTISMINRRFEELSGYSWKELEGKKWTDLVTKEYLERMKRYHEARRKRGEKAPTHYTFDFVNKKGQIRNALLTITLIPGTKKSVASILDITESKKAEKALLEAEEKYRKTIVNANVGIIGYSPEGEVKILNPKMEQMTGFKKMDIPTLRDWFEKLYPNKEERCNIRDKWFKRMSEEGEVKEGHAIITTKDGKRRNFLFNAVQLESGDFIAFANDITERKEAEEKLERMMNELVMINEKLGVVGKLTRHDARNKLSVIANNLYLAKQRLAGDHSGLEYLGDIESAIGQIEEIFDFARTYEMLGVEELSYVNVEKSVDEAAMLFSELSSVKLVNECHGLTVMADSLLRQLFYNLIDDTLKHGEKVNQIRVYYEEGEDQLKLVYEDDGVGIPEDEKKLIFKEGYGKGTGYGLYLIKKMCETYGWTIQETGKPGKGAKFTITIPKTNKNGKTTYRLH